MDEQTVVTVRVKPGSSRESVRIAEPDGAGLTLEVRVRAKAVEGQANSAVVALLARELGVRKSGVQLVRGAHSRVKHVAITAIEQEIRQTLDTGC